MPKFSKFILNKIASVFTAQGFSASAAGLQRPAKEAVQIINREMGSNHKTLSDAIAVFKATLPQATIAQWANEENTQKQTAKVQRLAALKQRRLTKKQVIDRYVVSSAEFSFEDYRSHPFYIDLIKSAVAKVNHRGPFRLVYYRSMPGQPVKLMRSFDYVIPDDVTNVNGYINRTWEERMKYDWFNGSSEYPLVRSPYDDEELMLLPQDELDQIKDTLVFMRPATDVIARRIAQSYAEGVSNCMLTPIKEHFESAIKLTKSKTTIVKYQTALNNIAIFLNKYPNGIPEDDVEVIAKTLKISIEIFDVAGDSIRKYNVSSGNRQCFEFINTRLNHVSSVACRNVIATITPEEMNARFVELHNNKEYFNYKGKPRGSAEDFVPSQLCTERGVFNVVNREKEVLDSFSDYTRIREYMIDECKERELADYLRSGLHSFGHNLYKGRNTKAKYQNLHEYDMSKAYTQFKSCSYYQGFPGLISNIRYLEGDYATKHQWVRDHVGMYTVRTYARHMIEDFGIVPQNTIKHLIDLGLIRDEEYEITLPSPMIVRLHKLCVVQDIIKGTWGSVFHFDFNHEIMNNKHYYVKWCGRLDMQLEPIATHMPGDETFVSHLKATLNGHEVKYWGTNELTVYTQPKSHKVAPHVYAFIQAYTALQVMDELFQYEHKNVIGVKLDSIVAVGDYHTTNPLFAEKKANVNFDWGKQQWFKAYQNTDKLVFGKPTQITKRVCYIMGQGGSGKTFDALTDKGYRNIEYASPMWAQSADVFRKYGHRHVTTIHSLLGLGCESYKSKFGQPPVIFYDEPTLGDGHWVDRLIDEYPNSQILIAGDFEEIEKGKPVVFNQCSNINPVTKKKYDSFCIKEDAQVITYEIDRRAANCQTLQKLKLDIRAIMRDTRNMTEFQASKVILHGILDRSTVKTMKINEFEPEDGAVIICPRNDSCVQFTEKFKGKVSPKYIVRKHDMKDVAKVFAGEKAYLTGQIVDHEVPNSEMRLAFTIHSYQGKTVDAPHKIYINCRDLFDRALLYTAVSRATQIDQLVLLI